jgi:hypothetical protein
MRCAFPQQQIFHCATRQNRCDRKCAIHFAGQILRAVHGDINALFHQRPLQLGRKNSFAPFCSVIQVEGARREIFKVTSTGSLDCAQDDMLMVASRANDFCRYLHEGPGPS